MPEVVRKIDKEELKLKKQNIADPNKPPFVLKDYED
jgi:hypothetical protein